MNLLSINNLSYRFSKNTKTLDDVSIHVPQGSIYGFLGPNGAGKTTTIRLLLGLLKKQEGEIKLFGKDFHQNRNEILGKVGSLIESPSIYAHLTAHENLRLYAKILSVGEDRITEVLNYVGLSDVRSKKAGKFSLGMKQRLGIAISLLHSPELLILDEPTNGLDPNGIIEIRNLLLNLNKEQGVTIFVSSHLLAEIEKMASHVGIIHHGKMIFEGTMTELKDQQKKESVFFEVDQPARAESIAIQYEVILTEGGIILPKGDKDRIADLNALLVQSGIRVFGISSANVDLEATFIKLVTDINEI